MKTTTRLLSLIAGFLILSSCQQQQQATLPESGLNPADFQSTSQEGSTDLFTLVNKNGMEVCITNFGGRIVSVMVPDRSGEKKDVVLGFDNIQDYITKSSDFGASIGRYANRIGGHQFPLDGQVITLPDNDNGNCLHGGPKGWQYRVYQATKVEKDCLELTLVSTDGDMNFPGEVTAKVTFLLTPDNAIDISYSATTTKKTVINMTNHSYFNLSGDPSTPATDHILWVNADAYTPVNDNFITLGTIDSVEGTPMDFRTAHEVGRDIDSDFEQVVFGHGYDHNWVLNTKGDIKECAARLMSPKTGITLEVYTDEPGIQVYAGNFLDGTVTGKNGVAYPRRASVCLETQHYPDSPNKPQWPSVFLEPGQTYHSHCIFKFSVN